MVSGDPFLQSSLYVTKEGNCVLILKRESPFYVDWFCHLIYFHVTRITELAESYDDVSTS